MPVVTILVGCKGGKSADECKTETEALVQTLRSADRPLIYPYAITLELGADGITYLAKHVELADLAGVLANRSKMMSMRERSAYGDGPGTVVVKVKADVPWSRVVALAEALEAEGDIHPIWLVPRAHKGTPPPRTPADDELDKLLAKAPSNETAMEYAKMMSKLAEPCAPLKKAFGSVSAVEDPNTRADILIAATGESLPECNCNVDLPALRSLMYRILDDPEPSDPRKVTLTKGGKPIALPAATPWKDAVQQLPEGAAVWLVAT